MKTEKLLIADICSAFIQNLIINIKTRLKFIRNLFYVQQAAGYIANNQFIVCATSLYFNFVIAEAEKPAWDYRYYR